MSTKPTTKQIAAYLAAVRLIADAVKELGSAPAGHLYAACMNNMNLETFNGIIERLIGAELVTMNASHIVTWIGK